LPDDRIVFVGDSITGRGGNGGENGWVAMIGRGLKEATPSSNYTLVPLGGSGQQVGSWLHTSKSPAPAVDAKPSYLDVKGVDMNIEFNRHTDVLVIMLGMNDALAPYLSDKPEEFKKWGDKYRDLIQTLRTRLTPRVIALATPTLCTEDINSPKNLVMDKMAEEMKSVAADEKCILLPTREAYKEVLYEGRKIRPDFHLNGDQVHPGLYGHVAIAMGMLRGLGAPDAAKSLFDHWFADLRKKEGAQPLSYELSLVPSLPPQAKLQFRLHVFNPGGQAKLDLPPGWNIHQLKTIPNETLFVLEAAPDRLVTHIMLHAGGKTRDIAIPAPWLVATANPGSWQGWNQGKFEAESAKIPFDDLVRTGTGLLSALAKAELKPGVPFKWGYFVSGVNYGGAGAPGAVDFAEHTFFGGAEYGYGLRWIQSERARQVIIKVSGCSFASSSHLQLWLNGESVFTGGPGRPAEATVPLKAGWNLLSFKSNYRQWQWQFLVDIDPVTGDNLDNLRFSVVPH
jgi:lysophospholipase L1-like esterase